MKTESVLNARQMEGREMLALIKTHAANGVGKGVSKERPLLSLWWHRFAERSQMKRDLETFTDAVLEDFGLTRREAIIEANKPFWRA